MSIDITNNSVDTETVNTINVETTSSVDVEVCKSTDLAVEVNRREYSIVGDELYIPKLYDDAPAWLQNLVDQTILTSLTVERDNLNTTVDSLNTMISEMEVAKNTYTQSIISSNDIDSRINTAITTLNSSLANSDASILNIAQTATTPDEARALVLSGIATELTNTANGSLGATIGNLQQAITDGDSANATSITTLNSTIEGVDDSVNANAGAVTALNTYVGITDGVSDGTGMLADVIDLQTQVDAKIEYWFNTSTNDPKNVWTTTELRTQHNKDVWYQTDTKKSYYYDSGTNLWVVITDKDALQAISDASTAQSTADGKVTTFYQDSAPTAEGVGDIWIDSNDGNKMYWWNGSSWGGDLVNTMVANASYATNLSTELNSGTNTWASADSSLSNTLNTTINNGDVAVQSKFAYNSTIGVNGVYYNSGFGINTDATSGGTGTDVNPYLSEFWIDASKFKFTNSNKTGSVSPFTIDATGTVPQITFNGIVDFTNSNMTTYDNSNVDLSNLALTDMSNVTTIDGGKITTGTLNADRIKANTIATDIGLINGYVQSSDFTTIGGSGFRLKSNALSTTADPTIYGAYIKAGELESGKIHKGSYYTDSTGVYLGAPTTFAILNFVQINVSGETVDSLSNQIVAGYGNSSTAGIRKRSTVSNVTLNFFIVQSGYGNGSSTTIRYYFDTFDSANNLANSYYIGNLVPYLPSTVLWCFSIAASVSVTIPLNGYVKVRRNTSNYNGDVHAGSGYISLSNI